MNSLLSHRLKIFPLTRSQVEVLLKDRQQLEKSLDLDPFGLQLNAPPSFLAELEEALSCYNLEQMRIHPEQFPWNAPWMIQHIQDRRLIGGIGLSGVPKHIHTVMVGYYIDARYEGQGYASEALKSMLDWIFDHAVIQKVWADTLTDGFPSQKVLQKNGFDLLGPVEDGLRWEKLRQAQE